MPEMDNHIDILFVAKRDTALEVVYYCPACEAVNSITDISSLSRLRCRECGQINDGTGARLDASPANPTEEIT